MNETLRAVAEANLRQALLVVRAYPAAGDALDMLAVLDPDEAEAFYGTLTAGLGYALAKYEPVTRVCGTCGTWRCASCGRERPHTVRGTEPACAGCGSREGVLRPVRHNRETWARHNPGVTWPELT